MSKKEQRSGGNWAFSWPILFSCIHKLIHNLVHCTGDFGNLRFISSNSCLDTVGYLLLSITSSSNKILLPISIFVLFLPLFGRNSAGQQSGYVRSVLSFFTFHPYPEVVCWGWWIKSENLDLIPNKGATKRPWSKVMRTQGCLHSG